jgi:hypothetical protein
MPESLWSRFKESNLNRNAISPAWEFLTKERIPTIKSGDYLPEDWDGTSRALDTAQKWLVPHSFLDIALMAAPMLRAGKYAKKAVNTLPTQRPTGSPKPGVYDYASSIRDELKSIPLTFGVPGTAINSHSIGLANANLKSTPVKELPRELWDTIRTLYNPEHAKKLNEKLVGPLSPQRAEEFFRAQILRSNPNLAQNRQGLSAAVNHALNAYEQTLPAGNRFAAVRKLEGAGLRTADTTAGKGATSLGTKPEIDVIGKPLSNVGGKNLNPLNLQKQLFDEPTFGEGYVNELWKRRAALREYDRASAVGLTDPEKIASKFATNMFGGYGADNPLLNSDKATEIARWMFVAPDWMRRHFNLTGNKIKSITSDISNPEFHPYRRALGYDVAQGMGAVGATKALTDQWGSEKAGNVTNVQLPDEFNGRIGVAKPAGTEMDAWRTLFDVGNSLTGFYADDKRDIGASFEPFKNRIHPVTKTGVETLFNTDWRGRSLWGEEKFSKNYTTGSGKTFIGREDIPLTDSIMRTGKNAIHNFLPSAYEGFTTDMYNSDGQSGLEFRAKMGELPFSFYRQPFTQRRDSRMNVRKRDR